MGPFLVSPLFFSNRKNKKKKKSLLFSTKAIIIIIPSIWFQVGVLYYNPPFILFLRPITKDPAAAAGPTDSAFFPTPLPKKWAKKKVKTLL